MSIIKFRNSSFVIFSGVEMKKEAIRFWGFLFEI